MGLALAERSDRCRAWIEQAGQLANVSALTLLSRGGRALEKTEVLQPLLTAVALGALDELGRLGVRAHVVAGHSSGELAAWVACGELEPERAIDLAAARGRLMAREASALAGGMFALLGGDDDVERALSLGRQHGAVDVAAHNAPGEWVLSGELAALRVVAGRFTGRMLSVSGPWHCRAMAGGVEELRAAVRSARRAPDGVRARSTQPCPELVCNRTGAVPRGEDIADLLAEQLVHPVAWASTIETLSARGISDYVTVGPGRVLRGLLRKNLGLHARVHATDRIEDMVRTAQGLGP